MDALMIFAYLTNRCHRSCGHCYWQSEKPSMTDDILKDSARWVAEVFKEEKISRLIVSVLGGEPLHEPDKMFRFIDGLPRPAEIIVNTNGDLITNDILCELKKRKVYIRLNPTYDSLKDIESKISMVKQTCGGCSLGIVLDEINMPRLESLTKIAIKHGSHVRVNRLYDGGGNGEYVREYTAQMFRMFDLLLEAKKPMWPCWIMESFYPLWEGRKNPYSCGRWLAVLDSDGTIRSCNADPETVIGSIYTHRHWDELKFHQRWSAKNLPECRDCEWVVWCQGGCPYTRKLTYGSYDQKSPFCSSFKVLFPKLMELKERWESFYRPSQVIKEITCSLT